MDQKKSKRAKYPFKDTKHILKYANLSFTVILVQTENSGNIGSIARLMENFNFTNLIIFNPMEDTKKIKSHETQGYAMHGKEVLLNANIIEIENQENYLIAFKKLINKFDYVIATTAKGERFSNIHRLAIFPENLNLPISKKRLNIALLFGKESTGLTNDEICCADLVLRIPTCNNYSALNLSHACGIVLYEIFKKIYTLDIGRGKNPVLLADRDDRLILLNIINNIIRTLKIRNHKENKVFFAFRNILGRIFMSKKELSLITGLFSKINSIIGNLNLYKTE